MYKVKASEEKRSEISVLGQNECAGMCVLRVDVVFTSIAYFVFLDRVSLARSSLLGLC